MISEVPIGSSHHLLLVFNQKNVTMDIKIQQTVNEIFLKSFSYIYNLGLHLRITLPRQGIPFQARIDRYVVNSVATTSAL